MQPFSFLLGLGSLAGLLLAGWRAPKKEAIRYVDAAVFAMFLTLISSRAGFVAVNWGYFASHLSESLLVWEEGCPALAH